MDTIYSKTVKHLQKLLLNLSDKMDLKRVINELLYQILAYTINGNI